MERRPPNERMTEEEVRRLCEEAKARGEPITPILRRFVVDTIDGVLDALKGQEIIN